jgi:hypothetical protein
MKSTHTIKLDKEGVSYTIDTIKTITDKYHFSYSYIYNENDGLLTIIFESDPDMCYYNSQYDDMIYEIFKYQNDNNDVMKTI